MMSMLPIETKVYDDGRTKQAFKDSTDINKIIKKAQRAGGIAHALKYDKAVYGEFTGVDLLGAFEQIGRAQAIFDDLPSEVRREFDNDAFKFAGYASDPANINRLPELIPSLAEPGRQFPRPGDLPPIVAAEAGPEAPAVAVAESAPDPAPSEPETA